MADPISIAGTAVALSSIAGLPYGILRIAQKDLNTLRSYDIPEEQQMANKLQTCATRLRDWNKTWKIEPESSSTYFEKLWGIDGQLRIRLQLAEILRRMEEIHTLLKKHQFKDHRTLSSIWKKRFRSVQINWRRNALKEQLEVLEYAVHALWELSLRFFQLALGPSKEDRSLSQDGVGPLEGFTKTRPNSEKLYLSCRRSSKQVYLLLTPHESVPQSHSSKFPTASSPWYRLRYDLLLYDANVEEIPHHLVIESLSEDDAHQAQQVAVDENMQEVESVDELLDFHTERRFNLKGSDTTDHAHFSLSEPYEALPLHGKLELLNENQPHWLSNLSLSERLRLAYIMNNWCLHLLGTSWLSQLSTSSISRLMLSNNEHCYALSGPPSPVSDFGSGLVGRLSGGQGRSIIPAQILRVGIVLGEIAMGAPQENDPWSAPWDRLKHIKQVESRMGLRYGQVVQCCFSISNSELSQPIAPVFPPSNRQTHAESAARDEDGKILPILSEYYLKVYLPMKSLAESQL